MQVIAIAQSSLDASLAQSGSNKSELLKVIDYYTKKDDAQKLKAAQYLLANMNGLYYIDGPMMKKYDPFFNYLDSLNKNNITKKDRTTLKLIQPIEDRWDAVSKTITQNDANATMAHYDASFVSSSFIIEHIDKAFEVWKNNTWSVTYTFDDFCEYILPYKVFNEKPELWMNYFADKYKPIMASFAGNIDPVTVADSVNKDVETWFKFGTLFYKYPFDMDLTRLLQ